MWDRGEPNGYANHMTTDPLPDTPAHKVLIEMAYGDHQVANVPTEVEARTIGAPLRRPALDPTGCRASTRSRSSALATLGDLTPGPAANGSGYFIWDIGPKRAGLGRRGRPRHRPAADHQHRAERLLRRRPARHGDHTSPAVRAQIAAFISPQGKITDPCGSAPCYAAGWTGPP